MGYQFVLQTEVARWEIDLRDNSQLPLGFFKGKPKAVKLAQRCAMIMRQVIPDRNKRLQALYIMFELREIPTSTYDLTVAQAKALESLAYTNSGVSEDFIKYVESIKEIL